MKDARAAPSRVRALTVYLPAQLSIVAVLVLSILLMSKDLIPSGAGRWGTLGLEAALLLVLVVTTPRDPREESRAQRRIRVALIVLLALANLVALARLARFLLLGGHVNARSLVLSGIVVWLTNIVIFALCFWELDRGGPRARARSEDLPPDFQFPQMTDERLCVGWHPEFVDYLYVSFTNPSAFGPTDTMPLSRRAKGLMLVQGFASLITLALVVSFAVNLLA